MAIEFHFEKRINNSAVVRDIDARQRRQWFLLTMLAALFVMGLLFYGWQFYRGIQIGYAREAAQLEREKLLELNKQYRLELVTLSTSSRIKEEARTKLGLVTPAPGQIIRLPHLAPVPLEPPALALATKE